MATKKEPAKAKAKAKKTETPEAPPEEEEAKPEEEEAEAPTEGEETPEEEAPEEGLAYYKTTEGVAIIGSEAGGWQSTYPTTFSVSAGILLEFKPSEVEKAKKDKDPNALALQKEKD